MVTRCSNITALRVSLLHVLVSFFPSHTSALTSCSTAGTDIGSAVFTFCTLYALRLIQPVLVEQVNSPYEALMTLYKIITAGHPSLTSLWLERSITGTSRFVCHQFSV